MKLPLIVLTVALALTPAGIASAKPSFAIDNDNSCSVCHTQIVSGRMDVIGADEMVDLGTELDGSERGPLSTFWVVPGESVTLSMEVLDGSSSGCSACSKFAVQLKRLEKGGQEIDLSNFLIWAEDNLPGNPWTRQEVTNPPYFTKDDGDDGGLPSQDAGPFSFDLFVDAATPPDFYDLEFAVAGKGGGLWYEDQHFYVQVVPEPSATLLGIVAVSAIAAVRRIGGRPPGLIG